MARKERLVFKGRIFKVYQWRQRMFDGTYRTFERIERASSAQVIAVVDGKIAIGIQSQPHTGQFKGFLGGRVEEGEKPLDAAKRELLEETGMKAASWKLIKVFIKPRSKIKFGIYLFAARDCKVVSKPKLESGERIRLKFIQLDELIGWKDTTARIGPEIALYFTEMRYDPQLKRQFARKLGLVS